MAWFINKNNDDIRKQLKEEREINERLVSHVSKLEEKNRILEVEYNKIKNELSTRQVLQNMDKKSEQKKINNEFTIEDFKSNLSIMKDYFQDQYKSISSYKSFNIFQEHLKTKEGTTNFNMHVNSRILSVNNLFYILEVAEQIERYSKICTLLNKLKQSLLLIKLIDLSNDDESENLQTYFKNVIGKQHQLVEFNMEKLNLSELMKQKIELESLLRKRGFNTFDKFLPESKKYTQTVKKVGQSDESCYTQLFLTTGTFKEAIRLYIKNTPEKELLVYDNLRKLKKALCSRGIFSPDTSIVKLYDNIRQTYYTQLFLTAGTYKKAL